MKPPTAPNKTRRRSARQPQMPKTQNFHTTLIPKTDTCSQPHETTFQNASRPTKIHENAPKNEPGPTRLRSQNDVLRQQAALPRPSND
jgi:hypothetical protein